MPAIDDNSADESAIARLMDRAYLVSFSMDVRGRQSYLVRKVPRSIGRADVSGVCGRDGSATSVDAIKAAARQRGVVYVDWHVTISQARKPVELVSLLSNRGLVPRADIIYHMPSYVAQSHGLPLLESDVPVSVHAELARRCGAETNHPAQRLEYAWLGPKVVKGLGALVADALPGAGESRDGERTPFDAHLLEMDLWLDEAQNSIAGERRGDERARAGRRYMAVKLAAYVRMMRRHVELANAPAAEILSQMRDDLRNVRFLVPGNALTDRPEVENWTERACGHLLRLVPSLREIGAATTKRPDGRSAPDDAPSP